VITYTRPDPTTETKQQALAFAVQLINHKSTAQIRLAVAGLLIENQRLTAECNDHRAARGIEPLPTHTERG
jgi:hypothetical protein